jgi:Fe-S oxidoreductase
MSAEQKVFRRMGLEAELLDSGCCGLAGSFGFEREHHGISLEIGEHKLMPMVRDAAADTLVIADGFSCKTQVEQMTERRPLHTAQVIKMAIDQGPAGVSGSRPEREYPDVKVAG